MADDQTESASAPERARFRAMTEATGADWLAIAKADHDFAQSLPHWLMGQLALLRDERHGFLIDRLEHCLQAATRAHRAGMDEEYVVCALMHDIGSMLAPRDHADFAAMVLKPFISEKNHWMLRHHDIFQTYYFNHFFGQDPNGREQFRGHPYFEYTADFCHRFDQAAFDPDYPSMPLEAFEPMVRRVLSSRALAAPSDASPVTAEDQALLERALADLEARGEIEYTGEFGNEITTFIPFVCWLKAEGRLAGRRVVTYAGMAPYYYFLDAGEYHEKSDQRAWLPVDERTWPSNSTYTATRRPWHRMPDYRQRYRDSGIRFSRPILFIQNKFTVEWDEGPINYMPLEQLERLLELSSGEVFQIIYSRPRTLPSAAGYSDDGNTFCDYPDLSMVRRFPKVLILEDYCADRGLPYNLTKLEMLAKSSVLVGVQGGGAHLLACFSDALLLVYHRRGWEYPHAYNHGPYRYLSNESQTLILTRTVEELQHGVDVIGGMRVGGGRLMLDPAHAAFFQPRV